MNKETEQHLSQTERNFIRVLRSGPKTSTALSADLEIPRSYVWILANRKRVKPMIEHSFDGYSLTNAGQEYVDQVRRSWA